MNVPPKGRGRGETTSGVSPIVAEDSIKDSYRLEWTVEDAGPYNLLGANIDRSTDIRLRFVAWNDSWRWEREAKRLPYNRKPPPTSVGARAPSTASGPPPSRREAMAGRRGRRPLPWVGGIAVTFVGQGLAPAVFDERFFSYIMDRRGRRSLQFIGCEHRSFDRYTATICGME